MKRMCVFVVLFLFSSFVQAGFLDKGESFGLQKKRGLLYKYGRVIHLNMTFYSCSRGILDGGISRSPGVFFRWRWR